MAYIQFLYFSGLFGISYLYWAILSFLIAMVTLFIRIHPLALPRNPSNWMLKKTVLNYFHSTAWLIIAYVCYRLYRKNGDLTIWVSIWLGIAIIMAIIYLIVWIVDRIRIRKMKVKNLKNKEQ